MRVHIVQQGDTLWKIARQHHVDFEHLKQLNSQLANPDFLMHGMEILLPEAVFINHDRNGNRMLAEVICTD